MSISFRPQDPALQNQGRDLVRRAAEMAQSDGVSDTELAELREIAASDGSINTREQLFLDNVQQASFDPNQTSFLVQNRSLVTDRQGKELVIQFSDQPLPQKQMVGDRQTALQTLEQLVPANRQAEFGALNKHNIADVQRFTQSLGLNTAQRVEFTQAYLTAHFNHPGEDIAWNGSSLQDGIDALPSDSQGRKYLDCEGFAEVAGLLLGAGQTSHYVLDANHSGQRNHQVAVFRAGDTAYVINNNQIKAVPNSREQPADRVIQSAFPQFDDIAEDTSGPRVIGTEVYAAPLGYTGDFADLGRSLPGSDITLEEIIDNTSMRGSVMRDNGSVYSVRVDLNPDTGQWRSEMALQAGDLLVDGNGKQINITGPNQGKITENGQEYPVQINVDANGVWSWIPATP